MFDEPVPAGTEREGPMLVGVPREIKAEEHRIGMTLGPVRELVRAATGEAVELWPDFSVAHRIQRYCDATILSDAERRWVSVSEIPE